MFIPDPDLDLDFLPIPDPGFRVQKGTGSRIRGIQIRNTGRAEGRSTLSYYRVQIKNEKAETCTSIRKMSFKIQYIQYVLTYY
jgi:hypothetical protein